MDDNELDKLIAMDHGNLWHPFTQMKGWADERPLVITEGRGCFLKAANGRWYFDGVSSLWVNIHGHRKAELDQAIRDQLDKISHTTLLGVANVPAVELAGRLAKLMDKSFGTGKLNRVFYSDNGSTAVEVALKMAYQYWIHKGRPEKSKFMALKEAYHGDTVGAMSVGGVEVFHSTFKPLMFDTFKAPAPYCYRCSLVESSTSLPTADDTEIDPDTGCGMKCLTEMESILQANHNEIAALIIEPLVQAAGGMIVAPDGYLRGVRELCSKYDVLMIADEVATGFGRTGKMFACEHEDVVPDIICLSKGITGGYMPLAVTIASEQIYTEFLGEFNELKTFFHGHSYTGNPLGCACALGCLGVFEQERTVESLGPKIEVFERWLSKFMELEHVGDVRNAGLMGAVELAKDTTTKTAYDWAEKIGWQVAYRAREHGVIIRPLDNIIVLMPPLAATVSELDEFMSAIGKSIEEATAAS